MEEILQSILAFIAIFGAIFAAMWLMNRAWKHPEACHSGCTDCPLKQECTKPEKQASNVQDVASDAAQDDEQNGIEAEEKRTEEDHTK